MAFILLSVKIDCIYRAKDKSIFLVLDSNPIILRGRK